MLVHMTTSTDLRVIGMNDEQTTCDKCGKVELRGTVIIVDPDGNEIGRYGTTCATLVLGNGQKVTRDSALSIERNRRYEVCWLLRAARKCVAAGDMARAMWYLKDARRYGLHRADEVALAEKIETAA
jgi:hypothetical protein